MPAFLSRLLVSAGLLLAASLPALADCASLDVQVKAAIGAGDTAALTTLADAVTKDTSCDSLYVANARRSMALAYLMAGDQPAGGYKKEFVLAAAAIAQPWQVAMALGTSNMTTRTIRPRCRPMKRRSTTFATPSRCRHRPRARPRNISPPAPIRPSRWRRPTSPRAASVASPRA